MQPRNFEEPGKEFSEGGFGSSRADRGGTEFHRPPEDKHSTSGGLSQVDVVFIVDYFVQISKANRTVAAAKACLQGNV